MLSYVFLVGLWDIANLARSEKISVPFNKENFPFQLSIEFWEHSLPIMSFRSMLAFLGMVDTTARILSHPMGMQIQVLAS